jgi:CubicO group peptidase (beta-lactamase class C family)
MGAPSPTARRAKRSWCLPCCLGGVAAAVCAVLWLGQSLGGILPPDSAPATLGGVLETARTHYGVPGIAGAVVTVERIETAAAGTLRLGAPGAATAEQYWHIGSNSKAFTATLAALLVADGKLAWDTTPEQLWPELAPLVDSGYRGVTLRELLTHRAGVPAYTAGAEFADVPDFPGDATARGRAFAAHVLRRPPAGPRGEYRYSNAGYAIAGAMLATAGGAPYGELLHARLLDPLGIRCTTGWPVLHGAAQPWGHSARLWGGWEVHDPADGYGLADYMAPAGDLALPLHDYGRFVQLHLRGLQGLAPLAEADAGKVPGLTAELIRDLHAPVGDYACGWRESELDGTPCSGHEGSLGTFHAITLIVPGRNTAVAVITNAGGDRAATAVQWAALELAK